MSLRVDFLHNYSKLEDVESTFIFFGGGYNGDRHRFLFGILCMTERLSYVAVNFPNSFLHCSAMKRAYLNVVYQKTSHDEIRNIHSS